MKPDWTIEEFKLVIELYYKENWSTILRQGRTEEVIYHRWANLLYQMFMIFGLETVEIETGEPPAAVRASKNFGRPMKHEDFVKEGERLLANRTPVNLRPTTMENALHLVALDEITAETGIAPKTLLDFRSGRRTLAREQNEKLRPALLRRGIRLADSKLVTHIGKRSEDKSRFRQTVYLDPVQAKKLREAAAISQYAASRFLSVEQPHFSIWENGKAHIPLDIAELYASALHVPVSAILNGAKEIKPPIDYPNDVKLRKMLIQELEKEMEAKGVTISDLRKTEIGKRTINEIFRRYDLPKYSFPRVLNMLGVSIIDLNKRVYQRIKSSLEAA